LRTENSRPRCVRCQRDLPRVISLGKIYFVLPGSMMGRSFCEEPRASSSERILAWLVGSPTYVRARHCRQTLRPAEVPPAVVRLGIRGYQRGQEVPARGLCHYVASSEQALEGAAFSVCFEEMTLPLAGTLEGADTSGGKSPLLKCGSCRKSVHARVFHAVEVQPREAHDDRCASCAGYGNRNRARNRRRIYLNLSATSTRTTHGGHANRGRTEGNMLDNIV
jgi:hypothetical protein